eukprot:1488755-Amphidinium_carterae.2
MSSSHLEIASPARVRHCTTGAGWKPAKPGAALLTAEELSGLASLLFPPPSKSFPLSSGEPFWLNVGRAPGTDSWAGPSPRLFGSRKPRSL